MADATVTTAAPKAEKKRKAPSEASKLREEAKTKQLAAACASLYPAKIASTANDAVQKTYIDAMTNHIQSMVCEHIQTMKRQRESKEDRFPETEYNFEPGSHKKKKATVSEPATDLSSIINSDAPADDTTEEDLAEVEDDGDTTLDDENDMSTPPTNDTKTETKDGKDVSKKVVKKQLCQLSPSAKYALQTFVIDYIIDALKHSAKDSDDAKTTIGNIFAIQRTDTFIRGSSRIMHHVCGTITRYESFINSFPEKAYDMSQALPANWVFPVKNKILCRYLRLLTRFLAERIWNTSTTSVGVSDITSIIGMLEIGNSEYLRGAGLIKSTDDYIAIGDFVANRMNKAAGLFVPPLTDDEKAVRKAKREEAKKKKEADTAAGVTTDAAPAKPPAKPKAAAAAAAAPAYNSEDTPAAAPAVAAAPAKKPTKPTK